jgi:hypothetical protein
MYLFIFFLRAFLNLFQITSEIRIVAMFLIIELETIFNIEFLIMCMIYLHTTFNLHNFSDLIVMAIKPKSTIYSVLYYCVF